MAQERGNCHSEGHGLGNVCFCRLGLTLEILGYSSVRVCECAKHKEDAYENAYREGIS